MSDIRRKKKPFKVDLTLTPEDREAYLKHLADARTTLPKAISWLKVHGYHQLSFGAVNRHRNFVRAQQKDEERERRRWSAVAEGLDRIAAIGKGATFTDGTLTLYEQRLFETLQDLREKESVTPAALLELSHAVSVAVKSRVAYEDHRRKQERGDPPDAPSRRHKAAPPAAPTETEYDKVLRIRQNLGLSTTPKVIARLMSEGDADSVPTGANMPSSAGEPDSFEPARACRSPV